MAFNLVVDSSESEESEQSDFEQQNCSDESPLNLQNPKLKKHQCPNCGKSYVRESKYWRHLRSHLNYHPYECKVCLECFSQKALLHAHKLTHTRLSKSFLCSECPRAFYHLSALNRHRLSHLEDPPYPCPLCDATFATLSNRSLHVKNHVVNCILCDLDFQDFTQLINHVNSVHRSEVTEENRHDKPGCIVPLEPNNEEMTASSSISIEDSNELEEDKKFTCFVCLQRFSSEESVKSHLKAHRLFMCSHCPKFFADASTLRDHEFGHTGQHPFKCDSCQSIFRSTKRLAYHQKECQITSDIHVIMDTINNAVDISSDVSSKVESAIKNVLNESSESNQCQNNNNILDSLIIQLSRQMEACQYSETLAVPQNMLNGEAYLSTRDIDESDTPTLDFSLHLHFFWLMCYLKETKSLSYPLAQSTYRKLVHVNSELCRALEEATGFVSKKHNYLGLMYLQQELSLLISRHMRSVCCQFS